VAGLLLKLEFEVWAAATIELFRSERASSSSKRVANLIALSRALLVAWCFPLSWWQQGLPNKSPGVENSVMHTLSLELGTISIRFVAVASLNARKGFFI